LAALLSRPGAPFSAAALIESLWGDAPPRSALTTLRSHVMRLRADLAAAGGESLMVTEGDGYRLCIGADDVDAGRFEALARDARMSTDSNTAIERYDAALELWRDEPYVEFGDASFAVFERIRLGELRARARERRTDIALATAASGELVGELEVRVRAKPYRERGWEQLALALFRGGRQADALAACRRARAVLVEDLGVEPGAGLRELERKLLHRLPTCWRHAQSGARAASHRPMPVPGPGRLRGSGRAVVRRPRAAHLGACRPSGRSVSRRADRPERRRQVVVGSRRADPGVAVGSATRLRGLAHRCSHTGKRWAGRLRSATA
jgi:DNA-binding SARP family transcriptional activator